jgi:hypothetical protein
MQQSRLNTWLSFRSAYPSKVAQFSVGVNTRGREAHKNYENTLGEGYDFNKALPSGKRPDAIDAENRIVRELKPGNPRAIRRGERQVEGYKKELEQMTGEKWTSHVDTYRQ